METIIILLTGVFVSVATYLILSKNFIRIILGTALLSHAGHLLIMTMGKLKRGGVPVIGDGDDGHVDALPQALILTSIVISFAVTAFLLVLAYRTYQEHRKDDISQLRGLKDE